MARLGSECRRRRGLGHRRARRPRRRRREGVLGRDLVGRQGRHVHRVPDIPPPANSAHPARRSHGGQSVSHAGQGRLLRVLVFLGDGLVLDIQLEEVVAVLGRRLPLRLGDRVVHRRGYCEAISILCRLLLDRLLRRRWPGGRVENIFGRSVEERRLRRVRIGRLTGCNSVRAFVRRLAGLMVETRVPVGLLDSWALDDRR